MFNRRLKIKLPTKQSIFRWVARQTENSLYLKQHFKKSIYYDLLSTHEMARFTKSPFLLKEEVKTFSKDQLRYPIIIDEIQKVPELLNEVHWLIENFNVQFILCGSSARKLKTQA